MYIYFLFLFLRIYLYKFVNWGSEMVWVFKGIFDIKKLKEICGGVIKRFYLYVKWSCLGNSYKVKEI